MLATDQLNQLYSQVTAHEALFLLAVHEAATPGTPVYQHLVIKLLNHTSADGLRAVSIRLGKAGYITRHTAPRVTGNAGRPHVEITLTNKAIQLLQRCGFTSSAIATKGITATDIVRKWDAVYPVFIKCSTWLQFLRLAAAGEQGCALGEWPEKLGGNPPKRATMNLWKEAGIATYTQTQRGKTKVPQRTWRVTDKGLSLIRLKA